MAEFTTHNSPKEGSSCMSCWEDLNSDIYVEYRSTDNSPWQPSGYCKICTEMLLNSQWNTYVTALANVKCKAEQRRLLEAGPPINLKDKTALPCPDDGEVHSLWYMVDNSIHSAKLTGSLEGEERMKYWEEQKKFQIQEEPDETNKNNEEKTDNV
jgi:hypothetical protein